MELKTRLSTAGSEAGLLEPQLERLGPVARSFAGLLLLASVGILPLGIGISPGKHAVSNTPGTTSLISIHESVSIADIWRALTNVHDAMLNTAVELDGAARTILYDHLWTLYE